MNKLIIVILISIISILYNAAPGNACQQKMDYQQVNEMLDIGYHPEKPPSIWWAQGHKHNEDFGDIALMSELAANVRRVVVAGKGDAADQLYKQMKSRVGAENIRRIKNSTNDAGILIKKSRTFKPDVILAITNKKSITLAPRQRYAVELKTAENLVSGVKTMATALRLLRSSEWIMNSEVPHEKLIKSKWFDPGNKELLKDLEFLKTANDFLQAIQDDLDAAKGGRYVLITSKTVDKLVEFSVDKSWDVIGEGFLIKNTPDFGGVDFVKFIERVNRHKKIDIKSIEQFGDSIVGLSWGILGMTISGGDVKVAKAFQGAGQTLASIGRDTTQGVFDFIYSRFNDNSQMHIDSWMARQELNLKTGKPIETFESYIGAQAVERMHLRSEFLDIVNDQYLNYIRLQTIAPPSTQTKENLGGVSMKMTITEKSIEKDPSGELVKIKNNILLSRP